MQCEQCHEREAIIFLVQIVHGKRTELNLCELCGPDIGTTRERHYIGGSGLAGTPNTFLDFFFQPNALPDDPRYTPEAYDLVHRSVDQACRAASFAVHVSPSAVAAAFRELALSEFGVRALPTLRGWGIHSCDDLGTIVFLLVKTGTLGSLPEDRHEDFSELYDFKTAFPRET